MKKLLIFLLIVTTLSAKETIKIGMNGIKPWVLIEENNISGVYPEVARALAKKLNLELEIVACPFKRCLVMLQRGELDGYIGIKTTKEREKYVRYLTTPYRMSNQKVLYISQDSKKKANVYEDLYNFNIAVKNGAKLFKRFDSDTKITKKLIVRDEQALIMLSKGRVDAWLIPEDRGEFLIASMGLEDKVKKSNFRYGTPGPRFPAFAKKSKLIHYFDDFEKAMAELKSSGELKEIYKREYFERFNIKDDGFIKLGP